MADRAGSRRVVDPVSKAGYELAFEDTFDGEALDETRWFPYYLPHWSSREASAARYKIAGGVLRLVIGAHSWCTGSQREMPSTAAPARGSIAVMRH